MKNDPILMAFGFDGQGGCEKLTSSEVVDWLNDEKLAWAHLDATDPETETWLRSQKTGLDDFVIDALLSDETRPRMLEHEEGALLILRGINLNHGADPEDMVSIRLWVQNHRIISLQRRKLKAVSDLAEKFSRGKGPKNAGEFITRLTTNLLERIEVFLTHLDERMDDIEEQVVESGDFELRSSIVDTRMKAIVYRRYLAPQRDAVGQIRMSDLDWLSDRDKRALQESHNHLLRYIEDLDSVRERAQIIKDELTALLADRMNKNMYVLSVIAAIFLPLGFLTGLLGINIGGIPGADNSYAFYLFCAFLILIVSLQFIIFKKLKWI